jgi:hypothetical protein
VKRKEALVRFFFMLTSEHKRKIQWIKGGNISLQKFFSWRRRGKQKEVQV